MKPTKPTNSNPSSSKSPQTPQSKRLVPFQGSNSSNLPIQNRFSSLIDYPQNPPTYSQIISRPVYTLEKTPFQKSLGSPSPSNTNKSANSYITNPNLQIVKILEEEEVQIQKQSFQSLIEFVFPKDSLFIGNRLRNYYEAILVDSGSVKITHNKNPVQNSNHQVDYSKIQILRILSLSDWKARPHTHKVLSNYSQNPSYNYYDYQEAWYNIFYLRCFSHSWFVFFDRNFDFNHGYPEWFVKWFLFLGHLVDTFPKPIKEGFLKFQELYVQNIPTHEYLLQFTILFKIPWILTWNFNIKPAEGLTPAKLERIARVKWWEKIPSDQVQNMTIQGVVNYFTHSNTEASMVCPTVCSTQPLGLSPMSEEEELRLLMSAPSKEELRKLLREIKGSPGSSSGSIKQEDVKPEDTVCQDSQDPYAEFSPYD